MQGDGRSGVRILVGARHFSPQRQDRLWGPPTFPIRVYWCSFPVIQRLGRYFDHSPPTRFGVKNEWSYNLRAFTAWTGKILPFTFYLYLCSLLYLSSLINVRFVHFFLLYRLAREKFNMPQFSCRYWARKWIGTLTIVSGIFRGFT